MVSANNTLTETLIIPDVTKTECLTLFLKKTQTHRQMGRSLTLPLEIVHCARNLKISVLSVRR